MYPFSFIYPFSPRHQDLLPTPQPPILSFDSNDFDLYFLPAQQQPTTLHFFNSFLQTLSNKQLTTTQTTTNCDVSATSYPFGGSHGTQTRAEGKAPRTDHPVDCRAGPNDVSCICLFAIKAIADLIKNNDKLTDCFIFYASSPLVVSQQIKCKYVPPHPQHAFLSCIKTKHKNNEWSRPIPSQAEPKTKEETAY